MATSSSKRNGASRRKAGTASEAPNGDAGPGPLDFGILGNSAGFLLKRAQLTVYQDFMRSFGAFDIRPAQFAVLVLVERNPGMKQSQISEALGIKRTNFVALLDSLEERDLVTRRPGAGDRRSYALHLTPQGEEMVAQMYAVEKQHERRLVERLGEDGRAQLMALLGKLAAGAEPDDGDGSEDAKPAHAPSRASVLDA